MQYEVDASSETHDPSQPSTTACPYLPGQTVNTLYIPVEQSGRKRSASLTSLRDEDFKTMDPASKFIAPRPAPSPPSEPARRIGTAPLRMQPQKRPARSPSPSSRWHFSPRKLFSRKSSSSSLRDAPTPRSEDERSLRSEGSRSRDLSPESLRRFLVDDAPLAAGDEDRHAIDIPEDIVEEPEDDDNFATSAVSEHMAFTGLSPPPQRIPSPPITTTFLAPAPPTRPAPRLPTLNTTAPSTMTTANYPLSAIRPTNITKDDARSPSTNSLPGFYLDLDDDEDDEDDYEEVEEEEMPAVSTSPFARVSTYSLPRTAVQDDEKPVLRSEIPEGGLGELVRELGWLGEYV